LREPQHVLLGVGEQRPKPRLTLARIGAHITYLSGVRQVFRTERDYLFAAVGAPTLARLCRVEARPTGWEWLWRWGLV